ncbi:MAG: class I SAM-dependent methyltransferase [Candidatus Thiocaldithrix dubininis]|uniref:Class I SAM-dependent methyltransferase n=1 Tax=Candidatus Thiocaldithrix dubininis TaxID=3080823 RepID=A0AA95H7G9_9GAMM|nr:MAG: class I SAM-dependent methyltransferase [Candidatus Thiocaldithrix dubininis]
MNIMNGNLQSIPYAVTEWNNYARLFSSVTPSMQLDVYKEACYYLNGNVIDCGCGSAKIAPFLVDNENISSYTGLDYSSEMVEVASWVVNQLGKINFKICQCKIEDYHNGSFDSAVSIQSYYSWPDPNIVLKNIFDLLKPNGTFVLATPNINLPLETLARDAWKELLTHPDFEAYKAYNLKLAMNPDAQFISLDNLVKQVSQIGFKLEAAHQQHFRGGLNFLVLSKRS